MTNGQSITWTPELVAKMDELRRELAAGMTKALANGDVCVCCGFVDCDSLPKYQPYEGGPSLQDQAADFLGLNDY